MAPRQSLLVNLGLSFFVSALLLASLEGLARLLERPRPDAPVARYLWNWEEKWSGDFYTVRSGAAVLTSETR